MKNTCGNCIHWKNQQMLVNYLNDIGFCVCPSMRFTTQTGRLAGVLDTEELRDRQKVSGNCSNDFENKGFGNVNESRYILTTDENFGCNQFEAKHTEKPKT